MRNFVGVLLLINSNLLVNFREYIHKIALTISIFQPNVHHIAFGGRAPPADPLGSDPPDPLAGLREPASKGRGWKWSGWRGEKRKGRKGGR